MLTSSLRPFGEPKKKLDIIKKIRQFTSTFYRSIDEQVVKRLTLRLRVLIMNSLARWGAGWGSRGLITMLLSRGSPGTIWKTNTIVMVKNKERKSKWQLWLVNMAILPLFTQLCTICEIIWQHEARQTQSINKLSGHFIKYLIQLQVCPFVTESGVRPSTWWKAQRESAVTLFVCDRHGISVLLTSWVRRH